MQMSTTLDYSAAYAQSAAIILLNHKNETPLIWRDDIPAFCLIGGGLKKSETFKQGLGRETWEEIIVDLNQFEEPEFLFELEGYESDTGKVMEHCQIFRMNIGNMPLKLGNEGIGLYWFPYDKVPKNMMSYQGAIIKESYKGPQPDTLQNPVRLSYTSKFQEFAPIHRSEYTMLDEWNAHASVIAKRAAGTLRYDPFKGGEIAQSLLAHAANNNLTATQNLRGMKPNF